MNSENDVIAERWTRYRYPRYAHDCTHPARLRSAAMWFGVPAPPTETARVLELGCAVGDNLLYMAARMPRATFVGVDLNPGAIADGQRIADDLGLENITLRACDIRELPVAGEPFDYIIAHGLYSWVPEDVRAHILALIAGRLTPNGVAHVSFNALPGWHVWGGFREMMLERFAHIDDPFVQAEHAMDYLSWLAEGQDGGDAWWSALVRSELVRSRVGDAANMAHDQLSPVNDPLWNRTFAEHAYAHGLSWVGQVDLDDNFVAERSPATHQLVDGVESRIERATLIDSVTGRTFSHSVVCLDHHRPRVPREPLQNAFWSARLTPPDDLQLDSTQAVTFHAVDGPSVQVQSRLFKEALRALSFGEPITLDALATHLRGHVGAEFVSDGDLADVHRALFHWAQLGVVRGDAEPVASPVELVGTPVVEPIVRYAAAGGHPVVGNRHNLLELDDVDRLLLPMLDGDNDLYDVARVLERRLGEGPIGGVKQDAELPPEGPERMALAASLLRARCRAWREAGLLVAR